MYSFLNQGGKNACPEKLYDGSIRAGLLCPRISQISCTTPTCYQTNGSHDATHRLGDSGGRHLPFHWKQKYTGSMKKNHHEPST